MRANWILAAVLAVCGVFASVRAEDAGKKKILFLSGGPSHGYAEHEHLAGCTLLSKRVNESGLPVTSEVIKGWPADPKAFDGVSAVVIYCDGGGGHIIMKHLDAFNELVKKGVGVGCIHYAVEVPTGDGGNALLGAIGGYFETFLSVNPHWLGDFKEFPSHPTASGVKPFKTQDEWYYHMRFKGNMEGVTPLITGVPPDSTRQNKKDAHGGNPEVYAGLGKNLKEHVVWVYQRPNNGGRGFGCTGGHFHRNWSQDDFRKAILNSIVWIAGLEVPAEGVVSKRPDAEELLLNIPENKKKPANFDMAKQIADVQALNEKK